ncbi:MAG TPA: alpha/beta fold hydrolase [Gemmatimonadales bacterium]
MSPLPSNLAIHDEHPVRGGRRLRVGLASGDGEVPGLLLLPGGGTREGPRAGFGAPGAVLLHGYSSRKELMADRVGAALLERGIASLAIDLPMHGDREPVQAQALRNPLHLLRQWRLALAETSEALRALGGVTGVDRGRLALVGFSMGAYVAVMAAAQDPAARAVVLAAGGDLPERTPLATLVRRAADPLRAVRRLGGRPLLMVHGRHDRTVLPEQAERLFAAASEPKTIRWWDTGHYLPPEAIADAAEWLAGTLEGRRESRVEGRG